MFQISLTRFEPQDPRLGRHVEHDERSLTYLVEELHPQRKSTFWGSDAPSLNQGKVGSCVGDAVCNFVNTDFAAHTHLSQDDALTVYSLATQLDTVPGRYPPNDTGTSGNAGAKAAVRLGYFTGYRWAMGFNQMLAALERTPLLVGSTWTHTMMRCVDGIVHTGALTRSNVAGGHEYLACGVDYEGSIGWGAELVIFRQSWGEWEGSRPGGYFAIPFREFGALLAQRGDVIVPMLRPTATV